jgi:methionyl-tRNA formyltransferase
VVTVRVVFFGTPDFAVPSLRALLSSPHQVVGVVTQPDRPSGRGRRVRFSPVKELAVETGVPLLQPERLKTPEFLGALDEMSPDIGVVAAYGKILPEAVLQVARLGMINVHASILPKYRGAAPVHRAVMAGERETGVSIMRVVRELDAGPVFAVTRRRIAEDETSADVERALATLGAVLLTRVIDDIAAGRSSETPQDDREATYAPKVTRDDGILDWSLPAAALRDRVRGLHPWPHAQARIGGERVSILRGEVAANSGPDRTPGTILAAGGDDLIVATGAGTLRVLQLQPEGKRAMSAREFLAGRRVQPGDRLEGPGTLP